MSYPQKTENLLNLSINATPLEREKSLDLSTGYFPTSNEWELIVKYSGSPEPISKISESISILLNEYAIVIIKEENLPSLIDLPNVEYIEKPKSLYFALDNALKSSCIASVQLDFNGLFGTDVIVAVIDSGIDIYNNDFRNEDGTTRILYLWDQTINGTPPENYFLGQEYDSEEINNIINGPRISPVIGFDSSGHGTAVTGAAAGNGRNSSGRYKGVASKSPIIFVKLATSQSNGFPRTTQLMQGVDYVIRKALSLQLPISVNISFGNNYGPHNNTFLLEQFLDDISNYWKSVISVGAGNEGNARGHTSVKVTNGETISTSLFIGEFEPALSLQLWKNYPDEISVRIISPSSSSYDIPLNISGPNRTVLDNTQLLIYVGEPSPYSTSQELYIDFIPIGNYVTGGEWRFEITGKRIRMGEINLWLPSNAVLSESTGFATPNEQLTLTVPSTAVKVITVGAYNSRTDSYADFSGRGDSTLTKPDLVAPGVDIMCPSSGNGYVLFSGTSIASPIVCGAAALLMEWGITRGIDPYLYGEKVKAYLLNGARNLPGFTTYPNPLIGWGALCVRDSLPL